MATPSNKDQSSSHTNKAEPSSSDTTTTIETDHTHPQTDHTHTDAEKHVADTPTTPQVTTTPGGEKSSEQAVSDEGGMSSSNAPKRVGEAQCVRSEVEGQSSAVAKELADEEGIKRKRKRDSDEGTCKCCIHLC